MYVSTTITNNHFKTARLDLNRFYCSNQAYGWFHLLFLFNFIFLKSWFIFPSVRIFFLCWISNFSRCTFVRIESFLTNSQTLCLRPFTIILNLSKIKNKVKKKKSKKKLANTFVRFQESISALRKKSFFWKSNFIFWQF